MNHSVIEFLRHAVVHHGYWAVAGVLLLENGGLPLPGEFVLLTASFLAYSEHELQLPWIIVVATIVTTVGGSLGFAIGYHGGRPLLERYQSVFRIQAKTVEQGETLFARFGAITVFFARFVFGMRVIASPLAGVLRMPWRKFLVWNFLGATVWVTVVSTAGYLFGRHWRRLEHIIRRIDVLIAIVIVVGLLWWWFRGRRRG